MKENTNIYKRNAKTIVQTDTLCCGNRSDVTSLSEASAFNELMRKRSNLLTTILFGVTSRGRAPSTGVAGALPLRQAFSYDVSETEPNNSRERAFRRLDSIMVIGVSCFGYARGGNSAVHERSKLKPRCGDDYIVCTNSCSRWLCH